MTAKFTLDNIIQTTNATIVKNSKDKHSLLSVSTDTRTISEDNIYIPLSGENFDGHNFIKTAIEKGAKGYLFSKGKNQDFFIDSDYFAFEVENTLQALLNLATLHRKENTSKIVGVTGSSGKTTTKELIYSVLSKKLNTLKSHLNFNNEIGVAKTLLEINKDTEITISEMGMRGLGEIELLSKTALPDFAVITNVGPCHIGRLGSIENIAIAKTELLKHLSPSHGVAFLYGEDELLLEYANKVFAGEVVLFGLKQNYDIQEITPEKMIFTYKDETYEISIPGEHNIINASVAIELAKHLGMDYEDIYDGLKSYKPITGRWEEFELSPQCKIINDSYNANPDSMKAAIEAVIKSYSNKKIWLVLGDMLELGEYEEQMHKELGDWLEDLAFDRLITVGEKGELIGGQLVFSNKAVDMVKTPEEAANIICKVSPQDVVILLKASRGIGLEKVIEVLKSEMGGMKN